MCVMSLVDVYQSLRMERGIATQRVMAVGEMHVWKKAAHATHNS